MGYITDVTEWRIEQGPSKYDLMLAVFDHSCHRPRPVTFGLRNGETEHPAPILVMDVVVTKVERADSFGESWDFEGVSVSASDGSVPNTDGGDKVEGRFNVKCRIGFLKLTQTRKD